MSFPEIGRFMGNKNHSTVILATRKINQLVKDDELVMRQTPAGLHSERLREIIEKVEEQLGKTGVSTKLRTEAVPPLMDGRVNHPVPMAVVPRIAAI